MAERRMFTQKIIDSDAFLDMPLTTQALYFHLNMRARDKGILLNAVSIARMLGCDESDIQNLINAGFIKKVQTGFEIVHWYENNGIGETAKKRNNYKYRQWRAAVISRDKKCLLCGSTENLVAHHVKSFADYPLLRTELSNGLTLCDKCHKKIHKEARKNG